MFKRITAAIMTFFTLASSFFGLPFVYKDYENEEEYDPDVGVIAVDLDMSVPRIILADNGASEYVIVKGAEATESESFAAETLQKYLKQISGVKIPIVADSTPEQEKEIIIGRTSREGDDSFTVDRRKLGEDGMNIFVSGEKLVLSGGGNRGTIYSVYTFLEETQGCRWFAKDFTVIPERTTVSVRRDLKIEQIPVFYNRDVYWRSTRDTDFAVALKINGTIKRELSGKYGGGMVYSEPAFVHTFNLLVPPEEYFEEHPEYYAYTEGKRQTTQLCLTNPDVLRIATENALKFLRQSPDADIISISQNDGDGYCECDNCKAIDDAEGSQAGTLLRFVNAIAEVIEKEFPDVLVDTLAYDYTRKAPSITRPRENVVMRLCTIECCFSHPIADCPVLDKSGKLFRDDIKAWKELCDNIHIWDYTTNFSHYIAPFPNIYVLQPNLQFFAENNVKSVFEQGNGKLDNNGEFSHLKTYLLAKLLWDPYTDFEKHMNEFMRAFYGEGFQYIRRYIDFSSDRAALNHIENNDNPSEMLYLSNADLKKIDEWFDKAESMAKNQFERDNIQSARIQVRYYKSFTRRGEFSFFRNSAKTGEALYDDMIRLGVTRLKERLPLLPKEEINFRLRIDKWNTPRTDK